MQLIQWGLKKQHGTSQCLEYGGLLANLWPKLS